MTVPSPISLITGGNRGIGRETVKQLAQRGFRVILTARSEEKGQAAADELGVEFMHMDVADAASITRAAAAIGKQIKRLDVLVNNAGIYEEGHGILDLEEATLNQMLRINTFGPLQVIQAFAPLLKAAEGARIINVSSRLGQLTASEVPTYSPAYSISKAALNVITQQCAATLREHAISVNSVCPGWVRTDMGGVNAERSIEQGADTIVWLASEAPSDLTGQFLTDRKPLGW